MPEYAARSGRSLGRRVRPGHGDDQRDEELPSHARMRASRRHLARWAACWPDMRRNRRHGGQEAPLSRSAAD